MRYYYITYDRCVPYGLKLDLKRKRILGGKFKLDLIKTNNI